MDVTNPPDKPWARLHVVRGAPPRQFRFEAQRPAELSIGSAPAAHLFLSASGVAPRQLELAWDGAALWLQDPLRLGCTLVNGRPLNEWLLIQGEALIAFSGIRLWVAARALLPLPVSPDFAALERARQGVPPMGSARRIPTVRLPNEELSAEQLAQLLNGVVGS